MISNNLSLSKFSYYDPDIVSSDCNSSDFTPTLKYIKEALEKYRSSPNCIKTKTFLDAIKDVIALDEEHYKEFTNSDLMDLRSICPKLNESYYMPFLEYIQQALTSDEDDFLERAKRVTFISEWDFQSLKKNNISVYSILSICPNLKIYVILECTKKIDTGFQNLPFIDQQLVSYQADQLYLLSSASIQTIDFITHILTYKTDNGLIYNEIDGELERQLSIIIKSDNGIEEENQFKCFFNYLLDPKDFSLYPEEEFDQLLQANTYFQSKKMTDDFEEFLKKTTYTDKEKQYFISIIVTIHGKTADGIVTRLGRTWLQYASAALRNDLDFMKPLIENDGTAYQYAGEQIRDMPDIALIAIAKDSNAGKYLGKRLRNNPKFIKYLLYKDFSYFQYGSEKVRNNLKLAYELLDNGKLFLSDLLYIGPDIRNDIEFFTKSIEKFAYSVLGYASEEVRNDFDFMKLAIEKYGWSAYKFASPFLKNSPDLFHIVIEFDKKNAQCALSYIAPDLKDNVEFFEKIIELFGYSAVYQGSTHVQDTIKIRPNAIHALCSSITDVKNAKKTIEFIIGVPLTRFEEASEEFRNNFDIAYAILKTKNIILLEYIGFNIKNSSEFFDEAFRLSFPKALCYASEEVRNNPTFMREHFLNLPINSLGEELKNDSEFILSVIEKYSLLTILKQSEEVKNNIIFASVLLNNENFDVTFLQYFSRNIRRNHEFIQKTIKRFGYTALDYARNRIKKMPEIIKRSISLLEDASEITHCIQLISGYPIYKFHLASKELRNNLDIAYAILKTNHAPNLEAIGVEVKDNLKFIQQAIEQFGYIALAYASNRIKMMPEIIKRSISPLEDASEITHCIQLISGYPIYQFHLASKELQNNLDIAYAILKTNHAPNLEAIGVEVKDNLKFIQKAIEQFDYSVLRIATDRIRNMPDIMYKAIEHDPSLAADLGYSLQNDSVFIKSLVTAYPACIQYLSENLQNDFEVAYLLINGENSSVDQIQHLGPDVKNDWQFIQAATQRFGDSVHQYSSDRIQEIVSFKNSNNQASIIENSTDTFFYERDYSLKSDVPQEIDYNGKKYELIQIKEVPYSWIEKIKLIAITFFSLGATLISKEIRERWSRILSRRKKQAIYSIKDGPLFYKKRDGELNLDFQCFSTNQIMENMFSSTFTQH